MSLLTPTGLGIPLLSSAPESSCMKSVPLPYQNLYVCRSLPLRVRAPWGQGLYLHLLILNTPLGWMLRQGIKGGRICSGLERYLKASIFKTDPLPVLKSPFCLFLLELHEPIPLFIYTVPVRSTDSDFKISEKRPRTCSCVSVDTCKYVSNYFVWNPKCFLSNSEPQTLIITLDSQSGINFKDMVFLDPEAWSKVHHFSSSSWAWITVQL